MIDSRRIEWVDIAKAFAIILVVIYHAGVIGIPLDLVGPVWGTINKGLEAFRMPVFFFAAGLFAESVIRRPWRDLWSSRIALLVWTYALWTVLRFAYFSAFPLETRPHETYLSLLLISPVWPSSGLWFLHALAVFFVLTKLIHQTPLWIKLTLAAILSGLFFSVLSTGNLSYNGMARYYVFFLCGTYLRDLALGLNEKPRWGLTVVAFALLGVASAIVHKFNAGEVFGTKTVLSLIAITAGCLLARTVAATPLAKTMVYIGKNTLPIYVQHIILLAAIATAADLYLADHLADSLEHIYPVLAAIIVIPLSLYIAKSVAKSPIGRFLFETPSWLARKPIKSTVDA